MFSPGQVADDKLIKDQAREEQPNEGEVGGRAVCQDCAQRLWLSGTNCVL